MTELSRPRVLLAGWQDVDLTVVIPTYNEAENIEAITQAVFDLPLSRLRLVIVDDDSPDGTGALADQLAERYRANDGLRMHVIHRKGKAGLGTAYIAGMRQALADGAEFVVQMDADFSHSPDYIPQMLLVALATGADVVIGSRYVPGGTLDEGWSWWRRFLSWWANLYSRGILRLRVRDMTAGFKLWRRSALLEIGLDSIRSNGYI
ncbi:MAG: polyprenol monophosphomannose synthase, partial [Caldilineae bacterium]